MPLTVTHEFHVDDVCAYIIAYGEYSDGEDTAETRSASAEARWSPTELQNMSVAQEVPGYAPIYTCGYCGDEHEGDGQHKVVILGTVGV